jgi:hypothetical protein
VGYGIILKEKNMDAKHKIDKLYNEIEQLNEKLYAMRKLLFDWNPTEIDVWEHKELEDLGETVEDYIDFVEEREDEDFIIDEDYDDE